ncbi:MAG: ATP-dependent Clp protease adapter ClpS [Bacteriovoracaceae bacterium]
MLFEQQALLKVVMGEGSETEGDPGVATAEKSKLKKPPMYKVLIHNDDYTTMEFVIHVLMKFFNKTYEESHAIMLKIHNDGVGICGIFTHEVAESKSHKVNRYSRGKGHPLKSSIEPCES